MICGAVFFIEFNSPLPRNRLDSEDNGEVSRSLIKFYYGGVTIS